MAVVQIDHNARGGAFRVNKSTRQRLRNRKRRIEHRLRDIAWSPQDQPMLRGTNVHYEIADRTRAIDVGGMPAMHVLAKRVGLANGIDERLHLLKVHLPYHESDHVLNIALNILSGGTCLEDLELRRNDESYLNALGTQRIPDPTTAGDFCRRFDEGHVEVLMRVINRARLRVWKHQPDEFFERAIVEADGTLAPTTGECKQGMDISYDGQWGFHPLIVSLANTAEPLFLVNRSGNRPSQEGAAERFDQALTLTRRAGFRSTLFRGDTDFSQTKHLDRWDAAGVKFVFGMDAMANLVQMADALPPEAWCPLVRRARDIKTEPRAKPERVKERIVLERRFENLHLLKEDVTQFDYSPGACDKTYRIVVVRKNLTRERGQEVLWSEHRYFFYITNLRDESAEEVVFLANDRCDQENLIAQLKSGVCALRMPVDTLVSNWAYMVMASLAWSLKAWFALMLPVFGRWREQHLAERQRLLRMEFRTFLDEIIRVPAQIVRTGRRIVVRLLAWRPMLHAFLRGTTVLRC